MSDGTELPEWELERLAANAPYMQSPAEIAERAKQVRDGWSEGEEARRNGYPAPDIEVTQIGLHAFVNKTPRRNTNTNH